MRCNNRETGKLDNHLGQKADRNCRPILWAGLEQRAVVGEHEGRAAVLAGHGDVPRELHEVLPMWQRKDDNRNHTGFMRNHDRQASNLFLGARILLGRAPRNEVVAAPTVEDLIGGLVIGGRAAPPEVVPDLHQGALGHLGTCLNPYHFLAVAATRRGTPHQARRRRPVIE